MSFWKRIRRALIAFIYLRLYELLCGLFVLTIIFYFSNSLGGAAEWREEPRPLYAFMSALGFIGIYYVLFKYLLASLLTILALGTTPYLRRAPLAAVNSLTYAVHALWVMLMLSGHWPLSIWAAWGVIVVVNGVSPVLLPDRLLSPKKY
ncbi:MAG: hypothetical protein ACRD2G_14650 [Terriglobia bacterium]